MRHSHLPPYHSPTQPPTLYRIPARRHPYQDCRDGSTSQFTPGGVAIQSPPRWSPQSSKFTSLCGFCSALDHTVHNCTAAERYVQSGQAIRTPYGGISFLEDPENSQPDPHNSPTLSDQSDAHLPNDLEKSIQIQIAALERAKALILARKNSSSSTTQSPVLPSPNPPYNIAMDSSVIPITTEDLHPRSPMQPIYPGNPDYPDDLNYPNSRENVTIEDYKPEIITLDFSRYELSDEPYERPKGPMQPIPVATDLDDKSQISGDVSNQLVIPSGIFAQSQDNEETAAATVDEFFDDFSDDIFEFEIESTQSSHKTSSSPVKPRSTTWYTVDPEVQDTPPSLPPLPLAILLDVPPSLVPDSTTSLSLPSPSPSLPPPSLPQVSDQRLGSVYQKQSFLWRFVTSASLFSGTPKLPWYSRPQLSELAVSRENKSFDLGIDAEDPADTAVSSDQSQSGSDEITKPLSPRDKPSEPVEPVEHLSVLADILMDYEELDDSPVAPRPSSRSPSLPSIVLDIATLGSFSANNSIALKSPRATIVALSKESPLGERSLPRECESLASLLPFSDYSMSVDPWISPLSPPPPPNQSLVELSQVVNNSPSSSPALPAIALEIETFDPFPLDDSTTFRSPLATVATPSGEPLRNLCSPPPSLPPVEQSPFTISLLFSTSPVPPSVTPTSPLNSPDEISPDGGFVCQCSPLTALAAPESSNGTAIRVAKVEEKVATPDAILDAPSYDRAMASLGSGTKCRASGLWSPPLTSPTSRDTIPVVQEPVSEPRHESRLLSLSLDSYVPDLSSFPLTLYFRCSSPAGFSHVSPHVPLMPSLTSFGTEEPCVRENEWFSGENPDKPSTMVPDTSPAKYSVPAHKSLPRSSVLATCCNRGVTALATNPESHQGLTRSRYPSPEILAITSTHLLRSLALMPSISPRSTPRLRSLSSPGLSRLSTTGHRLLHQRHPHRRDCISSFREVIETISPSVIPPPILSPPAVLHIDNSRPDQLSLSRIDSRTSRSISPRTRFQIPSTRPCSTDRIPHRRAPLPTPSISIRSIVSLTSRVLHPSLVAMYQTHRHASSIPLDHSDFNNPRRTTSRADLDVPTITHPACPRKTRHRSSRT